MDKTLLFLHVIASFFTTDLHNYFGNRKLVNVVKKGSWVSRFRAFFSGTPSNRSSCWKQYILKEPRPIQTLNCKHTQCITSTKKERQIPTVIIRVKTQQTISRNWFDDVSYTNEDATISCICFESDSLVTFVCFSKLLIAAIIC